MPPKRKRSSIFCASQAKRHKQNQRLDPAKRQEEAERQRLRRQEASTRATTSTSARVDSQHRRRQRDAEAHRVACQDEEKRSQERIRDASACVKPFETHQGAFKQSTSLWITIGHTLNTLCSAFSSGSGMLLLHFDLIILVVSIFRSGAA